VAGPAARVRVVLVVLALVRLAGPAGLAAARAGLAAARVPPLRA